MTPQGAVLTEAHRVRQVQLSAASAVLMLRIFRLLEPGNIDGTAPQWLQVMLQLIRRDRERSAALAGDYYRGLRSLELPGEPRFTPRYRPEFQEGPIRESLNFVGPVALRKEQARAARRQALPDLDKIAAGVAGAGQRHVLNAGRDTIYSLARDDSRAQGWARVSDGDPCFFCAILVSRGPVYKEDSFEESDPRFHGPGNHKVHDSCGCGLTVIFNRDAAATEAAKRLDDLWRSATAGLGGSEAILAFRRVYRAPAAAP